MTKLSTATTVLPSASIAEVSVGSQQELDVSYGSNEDRYMSSAASSDRKRSADATDDSTTGSKRRRTPWTASEDEILMKAVAKERETADVDDEDDFEDEDWDIIAQSLPGKSAVHCFKRFTKLTRGKKLDRSASISSSLGTQPHDADEMDDEGSTKESAANEASANDGAGDWSEDEINLLKRLVETYKDTAPRWNEVSANFVNHSPI